VAAYRGRRAGEKDRQQQHRHELPDRCGRERQSAVGRVFVPGVLDQWQHDAKRGRGQDDADQRAIAHHADPLEPHTEQESQGHRGDEAAPDHAGDRAAQGGDVDLQPPEEEEDAQP